MRHLRIDVLAPPMEDDRVELATWSSGTATAAAARRLSLVGDRGGRVELDSVWIHLGADARPARIEGFGIYAESAGDRVVSTKLDLEEPPPDAPRRHWPLRATDIDRLGHVNNAAYWHAVEEVLAEGGSDPRRPLRARLDHRHAIDLGDDVELAVHATEARVSLAFVVRARARAVAVIEPIQKQLQS
jgi:acyl-ACP thioesterase